MKPIVILNVLGLLGLLVFGIVRSGRNPAPLTPQKLEAIPSGSWILYYYMERTSPKASLGILTRRDDPNPETPTPYSFTLTPCLEGLKRFSQKGPFSLNVTEDGTCEVLPVPSKTSDQP